MRSFVVFLVVTLNSLLLPAAMAADMRAITEDGRKVLLSPDGKWRFDTRGPAAMNGAGDSPYQTRVKKFSLAFNTDEWRLLPPKDEEPNKRTLQHKTLPIHALIVADEIPAKTETMKEVILHNVKSAGASSTVLLDTTEPLGDKQVGAIRLAASVKGMDFVFSTYYYADDDGNIQVTCFTGQSLFFKYQSDCQKLLSGLTIK